MRGKKLLAAFLLGAGLCFLPVWGYGEVMEWMIEYKPSYMDFRLLEDRMDYIMRNPDVFLELDFWYGRFTRPRGLPKDLDISGKIVVTVSDNRNRFSYKSGISLLNEFKKTLRLICTYIEDVATDMDTDVVAVLYSREMIPLAYFYQGEYHLWEK